MGTKEPWKPQSRSDSTTEVMSLPLASDLLAGKGSLLSWKGEEGGKGEGNTDGVQRTGGDIHDSRTSITRMR